MGWIQEQPKGSGNFYKYEYRGGKNTYLGKCTENGFITDPNPELEAPPVEPVPPSQPAIEEREFQNILLQKLMQLKESNRTEMLDIEHAPDHEILVVKHEGNYKLLMRSNDEQDFDILRRSIADDDAMHDLREVSIEDKRYLVIDQIDGGEERDIVTEELKKEGREHGKKYHLLRMNRYMWGEDD